MQPFILWQKVEEPYIFGILSNLKKVEIGYIDSYGEKVYFAAYYEYEDIAEDYEPEVAPNSSQQFTGAQWNRYQQRKHYKTLRESLNNSSNPEYTRPQQSSAIPFQPLQHSDRIKQGVSNLLRQAQQRQQAKDQEVLKGVIDIHDLRQRQRMEEKLQQARRYGSAGYGMNDGDLFISPSISTKIGAWKVTQNWDEKIMDGYRYFLIGWIAIQLANGAEYTCEDFNFMSLIDFASSNELPLKLGIGNNVILDAQNPYFSSVQEYKQFVSDRSVAADLFNEQNTKRLPDKSLRTALAGDIILQKGGDPSSPQIVSHAQMVYNVKGNDLIIFQGNTGRNFFGQYIPTQVQQGIYNLDNGDYLRLYGIGNSTIGLLYNKAKFSGIYRWNYRRWNK